MTQPILITEKQAAVLLGCSVYKLQRDRQKGSPIPYIKVGRSVRYQPADIEAYISEQTFASTSQYDQGGPNNG